MKKVTVRKDGKYYGVPVEALYVAEGKDTITYKSRVPVREYEQLAGERFKATIRLKRVTYKMNLSPHMYAGILRNKLRCRQPELDITARAIQQLGGLRFKTKIGVDLQVEGTNKNGITRIEPKSLRILNPLKQGRVKALNLPNLYDTGKVCWGGITIPSGEGIEHAELLFSRFILSKFNRDLVSHHAMRNKENYQKILKERYDEMKRFTESEDVLAAREFYIKKARYGIGGTFINLEVATLFDMDNLEIDMITS